MTKKDIVQARLSVRGLPAMGKLELKRFRKWILNVAKEFQKEDPKVFAKNYRATLFN